MTVSVGPCEAWDAVSTCEDLIAGTASDILEHAGMAATEVLWALSGRQFGTCTVTLLPCRSDCQPLSPQYSSFYDPYWYSRYLWYTPPCYNSCMGACSCSSQSQFTLPRPVSSIISITADGSVVPTGSYEVRNYRTVVRTDDEIWPACNDGTWEVEVTFGVEVPHMGLIAAGELKCELIKALKQSKECRLPQRVQSVVRQGVTLAFVDPQTFLDKGRVGLYLCDLFISAFNPSGLKQASRIYNPDVPAAQYRT